MIRKSALQQGRVLPDLPRIIRRYFIINPTEKIALRQSSRRRPLKNLRTLASMTYN